MRIYFKPPAAMTPHDHITWGLHGIRAAIVLPEDIRYDGTIAAVIEESWNDVRAINFDGWNGSFHDMHIYPSINRLVVATDRKRGGYLGKLRKAARRYVELYREAERRDKERRVRRERARRARIRIALIRRGIWREKGD